LVSHVLQSLKRIEPEGNLTDLSDKTDLRKAQLPINDLELQTVLRQVPGGVVIAEAPSGEIIYQNEEAAHLSRRPLLHSGNFEHDMHTAFHQDGRRYQAEEYPIARALAGHIVTKEEILYRRSDGTPAYFLVNATPIRRSDDIISKVLSTYFDITDQRRAEHALKESEQRLSFALSSAELALWDLDITTGDAVVDEKPFALFGYKPGEINPSFNAWLSIIHADDKRSVLTQWVDHMEGKLPVYEVSVRLRTAQGDWKWALIRGRVTKRDGSGKPIQAVGTLLDIDRMKRAEIALRESEERFHSILQHAAIGIATVAPSGCWLSVNPKISDILGYPEDELLRRGNIKDVMHGADAAHFETSLQALLHNEISMFTVEQRYIRKDGSIIWVHLTASAVLDDRGVVKYLVSVIEDKTARKLAEQQLEEVQAQLRMATQIAQLGFWEWIPRRDEMYFSPEWKAQLGYSDDQLLNRWEEWESRVHPDDLGRVLANINALLAATSSDFIDEFRMRHRNGSYRWISVRCVTLFDGEGRLNKVVGTHLDITEQKMTQENIRLLVQHDALTGLPNRGLLYEFSEHLLAAARRSSSPLAVLFLDLDRFKAVNDTYGHKIGDGVLKEVARRLNQLMRAEDVISRLGGDEFVAILPKIRGKENAASVALKALKSLGQPYLIDGFELHLSPSIGISLFPRDGENLDTLIQKADAAMYKVKNSGCNNFQFFTPRLHGEWQKRIGLESRLRAGLERDEFDLHYQPVIDTRTDTVAGADALLRWPRAGETPVDPAIFIPIAENSGLILPLGEWILLQACRQHQLWIQQGLPPLSIAVHVSSVQFRKKEFRCMVAQAISVTGVDPTCLEIQIAETTVMNNVDDAAKVMHGLKELGLKISLDGFGTGNSNLRQLSRLPIDKLKVDRSLVRRMSVDKGSRAIADTIIALGRALDIQVVAEGIESENDLYILKQHHCHHAQGFHLGRPMPGYQFVEWYRRQPLH
jgi:diguanylate cyclase (GGDEF)-like protein/PAS domain S-box-containing protein